MSSDPSAKPRYRRTPALLGAITLFLLLAAAVVAFSEPVMGYLVDSCTAPRYRAVPREPCIDCPLHECEAIVLRAVNLALLLSLVLAGLAAWLRRRQARRA